MDSYPQIAMRFRTEVFTLFLIVALLTASLIATFMYGPMKRLFMDLMRTNVLSIAATAAAMLDPEVHQKIRTRTDQDTPDYKKLESELRRARDANRRRDLYVKYICSMRPYPQDPRTAEFVLDAEEEGVNKSNVGDIYKTTNPNYVVRFNDFQADEEFVADQWGVWLTANAPIRDVRNETVGAVGVDVSATDLNKMTRGLQEREDLKSALSRYVSEDILNEIIYAGRPSELYSQRKKVTALFADVRGFTTFSEQLSPEESVAMLNDYFGKMIEAVFKNAGHLNKFMGDGLMALFGALRDDEFQEEHAVQAALDMRTGLKDLQERWANSESRASEAMASLRIGIGINTGLAIVGNIGSKQRMEFTAIGDSINLASRLEQATRDLGVDILVSEYSYVAARSRFPFEPAGEIPIKGKTESVRTYTIRNFA
ncbi:MAG TPA: adenylate/guanylate cyclase domain-containing protein [Terrimicrobiaceae bacterium]